MMQILVNKFNKAINCITPKKNNTVYAEPHINGKVDCFDLINCNADNCLKTLNYLLHNYKGKKVCIYIEVYNDKRIPALNEYVKKIGNPDIKVKFVKSCWDKSDPKTARIKNYIKNSFIRHTCKIWLCDTGWAHFFDKTKKQTAINFCYGTPFKNGKLKNNKINWQHLDYMCETSMMTGRIHTSEYRPYFENILAIGYSRNDTIGGSNKIDAVNNWLKSNNCTGKKIIVYVPTFRPEKLDLSKTNIFGFDDKGDLDKILKESNAVLVTKLHPIQSEYATILPDNILLYKPSYDFTIYDLFSVSDALISDYSSISNDFLLSHKPVIYLFSDIDTYDRERGFAFDPIESVCCGDIAYNWEQLKSSIVKALSGKTEYDKAYWDKFKLWHKYDDFNSSKRSCELLWGLLK